MEFRSVRALRGPNIWARNAVLEVRLELGSFDRPPSQYPGLIERLAEWLPSLAGPGTRFSEQLRRGTNLGSVLMETALALQTLVGSPSMFGRCCSTGEPSVWCVVVGYQKEEVGRTALEAARRLCLAALNGQPFNVEVEVAQLRDVEYEARLGPSTAPIVQAALTRGIPVFRLSTCVHGYYQLGCGINQHLICGNRISRTSGVAESISEDKELTKDLLRSVGVPVPEGRPVADAADAWVAAQEIGLPVIVKPRDNDCGHGVSQRLMERDQVQAAYAAARHYSEEILVERFIEGVNHRLLVIGSAVVAATRREPPQVVGDGIQTIAELVERVNASKQHKIFKDYGWEDIVVDSPGALATLAEQGHAPGSVPASGERVLILRHGLLKDGGTILDITDHIHPTVAHHAVEAARVIGIDVAGIDVIASDIGRPLEEQGGVILEINFGPGFVQHRYPWTDPPRPIGEAVIARMFPEGANGWIPIVSVTGGPAATHIAQTITQLLSEDGRTVGLACRDGLFVGKRQLPVGTDDHASGVRTILMDRRVERAVIQTTVEDILRQGLTHERCDVAVVTSRGNGNSENVESGSAEDRLRAMRVLVESVVPGGAVVLMDDDPLAASLTDHCSSSVIYLACNANHPVVARHRHKGGRAVFLHEAGIRLAEGTMEETLPATVGQTERERETVLAAVAAAWALRLSRETIAARLETLAPP